MKIYKPYELTSIKFFNQTADFAEDELGVIWFDWNRKYTASLDSCYQEISIKGSCPLPYHKGDYPSLYLDNSYNGIEAPYNKFGCVSCCEHDMTIYDLIQRVNDCEPEEAIQIFGDYCGVEIIIP